MNSIELDPTVVEEMTEDELVEFHFRWNFWARDEQKPPAGNWITWLLMGGRGSGKTRAGAEWVRMQARECVGPIAIVGETITEAIAVMVNPGKKISAGRL